MQNKETTTKDVAPVSLENMNLKIFSDGADLDAIAEAYQSGLVKGFTTNPTLMAQVGVSHYITFAKEVLRLVPDLPVSFEVFSDDFEGMQTQALKLTELGENVYVKIPITNTKGDSAKDLINTLSHQGLQLNVTAILSISQVEKVAQTLSPTTPSIVSVFAGRIADTGRDPVPMMKQCLKILRPLPKAELLWASPREAFNITQADQMGCHIITITPGLLAKAKKIGKDLDEFSLETVKMFYDDALKSGFSI